MEYEELKCSICKDHYNENEKTPRLLTKCGHTYCEECLNLMIKENNQIKCHEDDILYEDSINDLPKNMILIKLIKKRNSALSVDNSNNNKQK
jgi:hypothetical protein